MKGTLHKTESGWEVWYAKPRTDNQNGYYLGSLPLHPDNVKDIDEWSQVFDHIESRIASDPEVEFDIIENQGEPLGRGEQPYKQYAKLIYKQD